jgi:hypothetical protein
MLFALSVALSSVAQAQQAAPALYSKEAPLRLDFDMENIPEPKQIETGYVYDFADGTFFQQVKQSFDFPRLARRLTGRPKESLNVNTHDEVPDSSWFTSRIGRRVMTDEEIRRGPDRTDGPTGALTVIRGKSIGVTPGFWIRDARGITWILKFDPPQYPELSTAAEIISTKFFYAIGYNVPENHLFRFTRDQLKLDPKAKFTDAEGRRRAMTQDDLDLILERVARASDGRFRCLASRLLEGRPKGGFSFHGVRADDPNDIIPHEHRRDLRALRLFCAWLEHDDIRVGNTLDMYVSEGGRSFLKHYLIDFGSTLGSDTVKPNITGVGYENRVDYHEGAKTFFTLGLYQSPWLDPGYETLFSPAIGIYSARHFHPRAWKPQFPIAAFDNLTERDAAWAAEIIDAFSDEQIRAVVSIGEYTRPADAAYLARQIIERRNRIVRAYLASGHGLRKFRIEREGRNLSLRFEDYRHGEAAQPGFIYEIKSVGAVPQLIAQGRLTDARMEFTDELIARISQSGATETERSVVQLTLRRPGEKHTARIFLHAPPDSGLRIAGLQL